MQGQIYNFTECWIISFFVVLLTSKNDHLPLWHGKASGSIPVMKNSKLNFRPQLPQSQLVPAPVLQSGPVFYSTSTLPPNTGKSRTKFLNLRDSVKKSPTKSTAKVSSSVHNFSIREHPLWNSVAHEKVCEGPQALDWVIKGRLEFCN